MEYLTHRQFCLYECENQVLGTKKTCSPINSLGASNKAQDNQSVSFRFSNGRLKGVQKVNSRPKAVISKWPS